MKKLYIIILLLIILLMRENNLFSQPDFVGDLGLKAITSSPRTITLTVELVSIPFEGRADKYYNPPMNRFGEIYNGSKYRFFDVSNTYIEYPIYYITTTNTSGDFLLDLASCNEIPTEGSVNGYWGYARYKITYFIDYEHPKNDETFVFYFNSLDSKYGKEDYPPSPPALQYWDRYSADWTIIYQESVNGYGKVLITGKHIGHPSFNHVFGEVTMGQQPVPEFKVWEMLGSIDGGSGWNSPWEENFYAHSTPFPVSQTVAEQFLRVFTLGTKVILDEVYENTGNYDRWGYNTQNNPYYNNPPISGYNDKGNTFVTPATVLIFNQEPYPGIKIIAESGDKMILKNNKKLWISGTNDPNWEGDTIHFKPGSTLELESNAKLSSCFYGVIINEGANVIWNNLSHHWVSANSELYYIGDNIVNNGGYIEIDNGGKLKLADNTILTFDGANSYLRLYPNSEVLLGNNAKIEFKNGAHINAQYVTFNKTGSSPWEGLYFENAGTQTIINNCTFNNVKNPIKIVNNQTTAMGYNKIIRNNIINLHQNGTHSIYAENVFDILIDGNTFNLPTPDGILRTGTYIKNYQNSSSNYNINIVNNTFSQGHFSVILHSLTSNLTPVYIYNNSFSSSGCADLIGIKISGDIKNNNFSASSLNRNLAFSMSNAYLYKNIMYAGNINMNLAGNSTVHLAPSTYNQDDLMWSAGQNQLNSQNSDNIHINFGNIYPDYGNNHFTCATNNYHLFGNLNTSSTLLNARNNCWYTGNNSAHGFLLNNSYQQVTINDQNSPNFQCPSNIPTQTDLIITDKGNGIYDTVVVTEDYPGPTLPEDERLYNLAVQKMDAELYLDAIAAYKYYIDSYTESQFLNTSLYELYECHEMLDTCDDQDYRDVLYGELRNYLDAKILSGLYDSEFEDIAYNLILMCEANMENLDIALEGYEFLALFHPDPEARILASWDWDAVLDLLDSGSSGGITEKIIIKDKQRRLKKFKKLIDSDPLMKKLHDTYKIEENKRKHNTVKVIRSRTRNDKSVNEKIIRAKDRDQKLKTRASTNLTILRYLSNEEKEKRLLEDITLINENKYGDNDNSTTTKIIPDNYSLSQNFPNPFNPTTTINYEIPKDGTVRLIVYDMLGREVSKLVNNEFKATGRYSIVFDGSSLSSGIYFYKIEAGSFTDIKRMALIK